MTPRTYSLAPSSSCPKFRLPLGYMLQCTYIFGIIRLLLYLTATRGRYGIMTLAPFSPSNWYVPGFAHFQTTIDSQEHLRLTTDLTLALDRPE